MIPKKDNLYIEIPVTFDSVSKPGGLGNDKFLLAGLCLFVWFLTAILCFFVDLTIFQKILYIVISFICVSTFARFIILREYYFMKKRKELIEKEFKYPYSTFWNIYEVSNTYPHICRFANGLKAVFVMFEKDVIVGRSEDNEYYHYEAISEAYRQMYKRNIDCMHIDYMDTVGKDDRINQLFDMAKSAENPILSEVLTRIFDNVEGIMQHSYASYDVYCFYYNGKDELFYDELEVVIDAFLEANYIRYRILDKDGVSELVKSVFNLEKFSVNYASEKLFSDLGGSYYLTPIWVQRGDEKKILNKTREEKEAERATREAEKSLRSSKVKRKTRKDKMLGKLRENEEIELFGDEYIESVEQQNNGFEQQYSEQLDNQQDYYQDNIVGSSQKESEYQDIEYVESPEEYEETFEEQPKESGILKNRNSNSFDEDEEIELF